MEITISSKNIYKVFHCTKEKTTANNVLSSNRSMWFYHQRNTFETSVDAKHQKVQLLQHRIKRISSVTLVQVSILNCTLVILNFNCFLGQPRVKKLTLESGFRRTE